MFNGGSRLNDGRQLRPLFPLVFEKIKIGSVIIRTVPIQTRAPEFADAIGGASFMHQAGGFQIAKKNPNRAFIGFQRSASPRSRHSRPLPRHSHPPSVIPAKAGIPPLLIWQEGCLASKQTDGFPFARE